VYDPPLLDQVPDAGVHVATPDELTGTSVHSVTVLPSPVARKPTVPDETGPDPDVVVEVNDPVAGRSMGVSSADRFVVVATPTTGSTVTSPGLDVEAA
jgi:hypothetical protein